MKKSMAGVYRYDIWIVRNKRIKNRFLTPCNYLTSPRDTRIRNRLVEQCMWDLVAGILVSRNSLFMLTVSRFSSVGRASDSQIFWEHEFESQQPHLCNSVWGQDWWQAGHQEVSMCSTRSGSWGMYITFASTMRIRQNPLWLWNPEETSPEIQNRGVSGPQKDMCVRQKLLKKKQNKNRVSLDIGEYGE